MWPVGRPVCEGGHVSALTRDDTSDRTPASQPVKCHLLMSQPRRLPDSDHAMLGWLVCVNM